jgi:hypothetical protein
MGASTGGTPIRASEADEKEVHTVVGTVGGSSLSECAARCAVLPVPAMGKSPRITCDR